MEPLGTPMAERNPSLLVRDNKTSMTLCRGVKKNTNCQPDFFLKPQIVLKSAQYKTLKMQQLGVF